MSYSTGSIDNLSPTKRALYEMLLNKKKEQSAAKNEIVPLARETDSFPVSFAQQRLWFLDQLEPGTPFHNLPSAARLSGKLDISALEQTLGEIMRRHEVLRTTFEQVDGQPRQIISPAQPFHLEVTDLSVLDPSAQQADVRRRAEEEALRPFDLSRGPLLRASLLRLSDEEHVILFTLHHIVSDAWSMAVFIREVMQLYAAYSKGEESPLAELPIQYADFAHWQRQWLQGDTLERQLSYWQEQLAGLSQLELPTDRPRPAVQSYRGARRSLVLDAALTGQLRAFSQREGVTLFMTLLAAFQSLLHHYSGSDDVVVGTDVAGRNRGETEGLIGFFVNQLVMRGNVGGDPRFVEMVGRVREMCLGAYGHQDVPFERVVEAINPQRSANQTPLFQVKFLLQNATMSVDSAPSSNEQDLIFTRMELANDAARFDMVLSLTEVRDEISALVDYATDLFDDATIGRMLRHFENLLQSAMADPSRRLSELNYLAEEERHELLVKWNETATGPLPDSCVQELFEEQAARTPDNVALVFEGEQLTYAELNAQANQLAHHLHKLGVRPGMRVAIFVERSLDLLIGLLGILKAGGAYLPLDPAYPQERLAKMFEDAQPSLLLTQEHLQDELPEHWAMVVCLDSERELIAGESDQNPPITTTPDNLAYVLYTSGSTGMPKGVMIPHRALVNSVRSLMSNYELKPGDRMLHCLSFSFDAAAGSFFPVIASGASVVLQRTIAQTTPEEFLSECRRLSITALQLPPSYWHQLVDELSRTERLLPETLSLLISGGESMIIEKLATLARKLVRPVRLINEYGPSEATITCTSYAPEMNAEAISNLNRLPVGRPTAHTQIYVLDEHLRPLPVGVPGELYVGGLNLAWGYFNRPDQTAEKFIPNPYAAAPGERLYRTGDRARYLPDGNLDFLGRADNQVKIRAFRIELGDIEAALGQHPALSQSVVVARADHSGEQRLVAYLVAKETPAPGVQELRGFLKERLPEYMLPSAFVMLDALPVLPSGKVDRSALPQPGEQKEAARVYLAPQTPTEEILANVWSQVLGIGQVGVNDNYFELGGDSIRSIQVLSRAAERGVNFSLQQIFQHQTIRDLAAAIAQTENVLSESALSEPFSLISEEDREKLPQDVEDAYPLTIAQSGMVLHNESRADIYHSIVSQHLQAPLDMDALRTALRQLIDRHPILRTSFQLSGFSEPLQLVHKNVEPALEVEDLRHLSFDEQEQEVMRRIEREKNSYFSWERAPLMSFQVLRRSDESFQFTFIAPHAILDGWSDGLFFTELLKRYISLVKDEALPVEPPPTVTFRDYVGLERQSLASAECQQYWHDKLHDAEIIKLPRWPQAARSDEQPQSSTITVTTSPEVFAGLTNLARLAGVPLKSVLLAAHLKVTSLIYGQPDVLTGMVFNGRPEEADGERVLGLFLNTLPLRFRLSDGTWLDLARECFEAEREMLPFRRYSLGQIQKELGGHSLFDTYFDYTHFHIYESVSDVQDVKVLGSVGNSVTNFTLAAFFNLNSALSQVTLSLSTNLNELSPEQSQTIGDYYARALTEMSREPLARHDRANLLSEAERRQQRELNETRMDYPRERMLHQLFEEQVACTPESIAVVFEDEQASYRELNERANRLARRLRLLGTGADVPVGLLAERSIEMVVGMLGVLKAGGVYVPLDPEYPQERLTYMLEDSGAKVLLTQRPLLERIEVGSLQTVALDACAEATGEESAENLPCFAAPENLAYIIYTSGSTGRPKGAMISHRSIVNHMTWMQAELPLSAVDRVLHKTPFSFDASVWEFYAPLLSGARLVIARPGGHQDPAYLTNTLIEQGITVLQVVPSLLRVLLDEPELARCQSLRRLFCGGEVLTAELIERFRNILPAEVFNLYGPAEATIETIYTNCTRANVNVPVPIGRPIANTQVYVLDEHLRPLGVGVPGELYIGGDGLGRGYLNRPELTAEKFIPNPFATTEGERLYRTGDLARYLPEGEIEFIGRVDSQIKIRGFRIELGEIEAVLNSHADIRAAVVIITETATGQQLVSYLVKRDEANVNTSDLRDYLRERLPDYMIPSFFIMLDEMPVTPNGKVDRRALPSPEMSERALESGYVAPRTPIEEMLCGIWREVLGVAQVGVHDNFFELRGHSLQVIRVVSRAREVFQLDLPLRSLFETPTVAGLAEKIEKALLEGQRLQSQPIVPVSRDGELPLSFAQQRLWFIDQLESGSYAYNVPTALQLSGALDVESLERALSEVVRRHEILRTSFPTIAEQPRQFIAPPERMKLPVIDLSGLEEAERQAKARRLVNAEAIRPFDLASGPLLRVQLLRLEEEEHILLFTLHHIISDGWSTGILTREFTTLYQAFTQQQPSPLPEPLLHYADFAAWQRNWLQGEVLETQLAYWKRQLGGTLPVLQLPTARPRASVTAYVGARYSFSLPVELAQDLRGLSQREGVTLFMTLLAAWNVLLYRYTGQEDLIVGTANANRNRGEVEHLIGFFVNMLALRTDLSGRPSFKELLRRVREVTLGAYAHQDLPFEKIVEELHVERKVGYTPVFQVAFGLQNAPIQSGALSSSLRVKPLQQANEAARYDLTLWMSESGERLGGSWTYNPQLFDAETIKRMQTNFTTLLRNIVADPDAQLDALEHLTEDEKQEQAARERTEHERGRRTLLSARPQAIRIPAKS